MGRQRLVQILFLSFCAHLVVFWPLPASRIHVPAPGKRLHVEIVQAEDSAAADVEERPVGKVDIAVSAPARAPQPGSGLDRPRESQGGSQVGAVRSDPASRGAAQKKKFVAMPEDRDASPLDLHAYKFAVALAALELRPPTRSGFDFNGTVVVDIHLANGTKIPLVALAESSGVDAVDTLALQMIQRAVERVAMPALGEELRGLVRLSVVFEPEGP